MVGSRVKVICSLVVFRICCWFEERVGEEAEAEAEAVVGVEEGGVEVKEEEVIIFAPVKFVVGLTSSASASGSEIG